MSKWAQECIQNQDICKLAEYSLGVKDILFLLKCNMSEKDACKLFPCNDFWNTFFKTWCKVNYHEPQNGAAVEGQVLWFNSMIRKNNCVIRNSCAIQAGLIFVEQLFNQTRLKTFSKIQTEFGNVFSWLEFESLCRSIPNYWLFLLHNDNLIDDYVLLFEIVEKKALAKKMYKKLISSNIAQQNSARIWAKLLGNDFNYGMQMEALTNIYQITNITKLRNFQFRLLQGNIYCNNVLFYWKNQIITAIRLL